MYYKKNEKLQTLLHQRVNRKNTKSIVDIFTQTINNMDIYNALDSYMTLHIIAAWSVKNRQSRTFPCITAKIARIMDVLYREIRWKSDKKRRYPSPNMIFIHLGAPRSLKDIYEMYEDDQDDYCNLIIRRINSFLSD